MGIVTVILDVGEESEKAQEREEEKLQRLPETSEQTEFLVCDSSS